MINTRKLIKMARKWQRKAALKRKRVISFPNLNNNNSVEGAAKAQKGHFVVYTADQKRYSFPIAYLNNYIFSQLFKMAEEEFGLPSDGPITVPCEGIFMDYLISLMQRKATKEIIEKALLFVAYRCSSASSYSLHRQKGTNQHLLIVM